MISTIRFKYKDGGIYSIKAKGSFVVDNRKNELKVGKSSFCLNNVKNVIVTNETGSIEIYKS